MRLKGKCILVTGGTGFIGRRLVEKLVLEQDAHVRVLVRNFKRAAGIACLPIDMLGGDIRDKTSVKKAVQGCDIVFHCAYDFAGTRGDQKKAGIQGTRNVSEAVLRAGVSRMVHMSTFAVYGVMPDGDLTESTPWQPSKNVYTKVKRESERLVLDMHRRKGLPVVVVQPTLVYGPFSDHWTINPSNKLLTGLVPLVNGGQGYCNVVYIDDVVDAMLLAATQPNLLGETFLVSGPESVTWKAFYDALQAALGVQATLDMSEQEIEELLRQRARNTGSLPLLMNWVRDPQVFAPLVRLPIVQMGVRILRKCLSDAGWQSLKRRVFCSQPQVSRQDSRRNLPTHIPNASLLDLYTSRTHVCIDKAKSRLTYIPKFDFKRGMALTARFIHWAGLAPGAPAGGGQETALRSKH